MKWNDPEVAPSQLNWDPPSWNGLRFESREEAEEDKESSGSSQSQEQNGTRPPTHLSLLRGFEAKRKLEKVGMPTGKSLSPSRVKSPFKPARDFSQTQPMPSCPEVKPPQIMFGKTTPLLKEHDLNLDPNPFEETVGPIGNPFGPPLSPVNWRQFQQVYEFKVITPLDVSSVITPVLYQWNVIVMSSGDPQPLENPDEPGQKLATTLTLRIPGRNFGMATRVKQMLLWMNFEELLQSEICSDGLIGIRFVLKSSALLGYYCVNACGSRQICPQNSGGLSWTPKPLQPLEDEFM